MNVEVIAKTLGAVVTGMGAIVAFYYKAVKPYVRKLVREREKRNIAIQDLINGLQKIDSLSVVVDDIKVTLMPNGGSHMIDIMRRTEKKINVLSEKFDSIEEDTRLFHNIQGTPFLVFDEKGECSYVSPAVCKVVERSESELMGNKWISCIAYEDRARIITAWEQSLIKQMQFNEKYKFHTPSGLIKVHSVVNHKVKDGHYNGSVGTIINEN